MINSDAIIECKNQFYDPSTRKATLKLNETSQIKSKKHEKEFNGDNALRLFTREK